MVHLSVNHSVDFKTISASIFQHHLSTNHHLSVDFSTISSIDLSANLSVASAPLSVHLSANLSFDISTITVNLSAI